MASSLAVFETDTGKSTHLIKSCLKLESQKKKIKYRNKRNFYIDLHLQDRA